MNKDNTIKHTFDLLKMDLRRTFRTQPFYWFLLCAATMVMVVFTAEVDPSITLTELLGAYTANAFDPMASMMGISIVPLFAMIAFVLNIGGDFSTGFSKNIFTFHSNKWEYIISKVILGSIISCLYILFYMVGFFIVGTFMGFPLGIASIAEIVLFVFQKMLLTIPLSTIVLLVMMIVRNRGWGIVAGIVISMGAITIFMSMGATALTTMTGSDFGWLSTIAGWFVSGCSNGILIKASVTGFMQAGIVSIIWTLLSSVLSWVVLNKKDII